MFENKSVGISEENRLIKNHTHQRIQKKDGNNIVKSLHRHKHKRIHTPYAHISNIDTTNKSSRIQDDAR